MEIRITIEGVSPLLMNRFTDEAEVATTSGHVPVFAGDSRGTPREQAEKTAYRNRESGELFLPGPNLLAALVDAGRFHKVGRTKVTTARSSLVPAGVTVPELMIPLGTSEFEVDSRRVRIPATGGSVMRHRARLDEWEASFTLDVDATIFKPAFVRQLVDDAGKKVGIGDYRPSTRGPFGKFVVKRWEPERAAA
jgi:hypothetical protein